MPEPDGAARHWPVAVNGHPADVAVDASDGQVTLELPDGTVVEIHADVFRALSIAANVELAARPSRRDG